MNELEKEEAVFEIGVVIPRRIIQEKDESSDCACVLVEEFKKVGFVVERVVGIADEFIKVRFFSISFYFEFFLSSCGYVKCNLCIQIQMFLKCFHALENFISILGGVSVL